MTGNILGAHPNAFLIDEDDGLYEWFDDIKDHDPFNPTLLKPIINTAKEKYRDPRAWVTPDNSLKPRVTHLILKAPNLTYRWRRLARLNCSVRWIGLIRDPRSVAASMMQLTHFSMTDNQRKWMEKAPGLPVRFQSSIEALKSASTSEATKCAIVWRVKTELIDEFLAVGLIGTRFFYEALISEPRRVVPEMLRASKLAPHPQPLDHASVLKGVGPGFTRRDRRIDVHSRAKWKRQLNTNQEAEILSVAGDLARKLGYQKQGFEPKKSLLEGHRSGLKTVSKRGMGPTVILHIGLHKTGSTALQVFATENAERLKSKGVHVSFAGRPSRFPHGNHQLVWDIQNGDTGSPNLDFLKKEISKSEGRHFFISSEDFSLLNSSQITQLGRLLAGYDVRVIVYLRNQVELIESLYRTDVTHFDEARDFRAYYNAKQNRYNFQSFLQPWLDVFSIENVVVRLYDPKHLCDGDVVSDLFGHYLGLDLSGFRRPMADINHGLPSVVVRGMAMLRQNAAGNRLIMGFHDWATKNRKKCGTGYTFLPYKQAVVLSERFRDTNEWVRENFFPNLEDKDFLLPLTGQESRQNPDLYLSEVFARFMADSKFARGAV